MPVKKGDFITVNYVCKVKETGEVVDSTVEMEEHHHSEEEEHPHEPLLVVVGEGWIPKGLDEALTGVEIGKKFEVEVPSDKGYGERDQSKVRLIPLRRFRRDNLNPAPGMQLQIDGKPATIRAVGAGRVQADFNHPLAGKTLLYDVTVEKILRTSADKVKSLMHRRLPSVNLKRIGLKITPSEASIELPDETFLIEGLQMSKRQIASDVQKYFPKITEVSFIERFKRSTRAKSTKKSSPPSRKRRSSPQGKR